METSLAGAIMKGMEIINNKFTIFKVIIYFPRQSLERFTFRVKSSDLIFFILGLLLSSINLTLKVNLSKSFTWKILFNSLRNFKGT